MLMLNTFQQTEHAMLPTATHDERSRQEFTKSFKQFIQGKLLPGLEPVFKARASKRFTREQGHEPRDRHDIRKAMLKDGYFQHYAATNRISQELMWDSVVDSVNRQLPELISKAKTFSGESGAPLETDPEFPTPRYVTALDIHCMPGGYAGESGQDDIGAGALYDRGVYLYAMGYMGPFNDDMGRSVANYLRRNMPDFQPHRILDMGCTVGHSTVPYKEAFPEAEVFGIDVAGPCIRYAHARAAAMGQEVGFLQRNAEETGFESETFDLIVSHILLHETSGQAMPRIFRECHRLLKPRGLMIHADLPPFYKMDPFAQFIIDNETYFNNEPFWGAMREMDQIRLAVDAGFPEESIRFDTAPMATLEMLDAPVQEDTEFRAGEYAPGNGWEVLIARKAA